MADQEFSSPGEHMASRSSGSSGSSVAYRNPNQMYYSDNVSFGPPIYYAPSVDGGSSNAKEYLDELRESNRYNQRLYDNANRYNYSLYSNAIEWYERMQNSSIQRMVEDMKRAGINPVLAGRYGGYNVQMPNVPYNNNMPYLDISSYASTLNTETNAMVSMINTDKELKQSEKNILINAMTQLEKVAQETTTSKEINDKRIEAEKIISDLDRELEKTRIETSTKNTWILAISGFASKVLDIAMPFVTSGISGAMKGAIGFTG